MDSEIIRMLQFQDIELTDLQVLATLGVGGFGRVELVKVNLLVKISFCAHPSPLARHIAVHWSLGSKNHGRFTLLGIVTEHKALISMDNVLIISER